MLAPPLLLLLGLSFSSMVNSTPKFYLVETKDQGKLLDHKGKVPRGRTSRPRGRDHGISNFTGLDYGMPEIKNEHQPFQAQQITDAPKKKGNDYGNSKTYSKTSKTSSKKTITKTKITKTSTK